MTTTPKTNEEIIEENAMKLTRDWDSFKQTKLHLQYMLTEARRSAIQEAIAKLEEMKKTYKEYWVINATKAILEKMI